MNRLIHTTVLLFAIAFTGSAQTAWTLDRSHTGIKFSIRHMMISDVEGIFRDFDIVFKSDKEDFTDAVIEATITTDSIDTQNARRDNHLRSDDFFNAAKYPTITFKSSKVELVGEKAYKFYGDLTIRDVTKPVVFDATLGGTTKTQRGTVAGWKATLVIDRFDFNLKWDRTIEAGGLVAGRDVTITINAEVRKQEKGDRS